jgi:nicotinamide mononucleotide (NMN) deamidase PncC
MMAEGARRAFDADIALAVTGVSGPSTEEGKPVGLTYVAGVLRDTVVTRELSFNGARASNRLAAVEAALELALDLASGTD